MMARAGNRSFGAVGLGFSLVLALACGDEGEAADGVQPVELPPVPPARDEVPAILSSQDELLPAERPSSARPASSTAGAFECEDTCASKRAECGSVCDESCGECPSNERCEDGKCVCQASCDGSRCIDDCGRPCACPVGSACNAGGFCVAVDACADGSCPAELSPPGAPAAPPTPPVPPIPAGSEL